MAALRENFDLVEADPDFRVGVCVRGLEGPLSGYGFGVGEHRVFESASLIKVLVLAELLRQADEGNVSLQQRMFIRDEDLVEDSAFVRRAGAPRPMSVKDLAEGMITESDNAATNRLISLVGKDRVNALARELRLKQTILARDMMDFEARSRGEHNLTSASDMVALLRRIWEGRLLSPESRELAFHFLERQRLTSKLPIPLPPGARFAHKTGELEGIEHDAGVVLLRGRSFALSFLTGGEADRFAQHTQRAVVPMLGFFSGTSRRETA